MALIIAVANQKGGAGKTTTTCGLGAALAEKGRNVLLFDLDPQGGLSDALGIKGSGGELFAALYGREALDRLIVKTPSGLACVPNGPRFEGFTPAAATQDDRESFLKDSLSRTHLSKWDYILIDCPPRLDLISTNALTAAHAVLIPIILEAPSISPFATLLQQIEVVRKKWNETLVISGVVPCKVDFRDNQTREILAWLKATRSDVFQTTIQKNVRLSEAHNQKEPVTIYAPESSGAQNYRALAEEFERRHGVSWLEAAN